ncbi:sodium/hexose cotransport protein [Catenovulum agarivorans DS-2]|uniref:Sodium/hexose cotransport protein n=1 Tax=Catenovulum agarivorans DS-2 TaxID=1328313 RepID=W7Q8K0_9ALTE|nr:sodium/sugar symporter [Catenovulum agarivorans]EWH09119.1 sodium/hexose cotransport protein [Catenovulum agarivorans DS-2]
MQLTDLDITIFIFYAIGLLVLALWVSREEKSHQKNTEDYFLASKSLPWWAIGASLIAANISAEQIIGMSGSGFAIGLAIASYEWMAAITLLIVGKYFLPIFLERGIYTMPQFLEQRYDSRVRTVMATFWLGVYVLVNLTSILWLGGLAVETVSGMPALFGMIFIAIFSIAYSLYGGLKAVAFTDIIQVVLLVGGGFILTYICLDTIADGQGAMLGFDMLLEQAPEKFDMILASDHPNYIDLPGLSVLLGGMWIMNLSYWGFNQYIIQRALAAKDINEAHKGIAFAAYLKILMPIIVVLPGICAVLIAPDLERPDKAYPAMMTLMPEGLKGLIFAALIAAIVSSVASMTNSISTIFTMDLYKHVKKDASQSHYVNVGRMVSLLSLAIAVLVAKPLLAGFEQAFQYIQEFTGFFTPGICVIFILGLFYKKTTANAALVAAVGSAVLSLAFKFIFPELPFMDRVGLVFVLCIALAIGISHLEGGKGEKGVDLAGISFDTKTTFNLASVGCVLILAGLYAAWW